VTACRACVILPRMPDAEAAPFDPFGEGVPWATKLFGICGLGPFEAFRESQTLLVAQNISRLLELRLMLKPSCQAAVEVGGLVVSRRLEDEEVPQPVGWAPTVLEVVEIAFLDANSGSIRQVLMSLPFKVVRFGEGLPGDIGDWHVTDFDWMPELPNLAAELAEFR
jgi:hypothetical protein